MALLRQVVPQLRELERRLGLRVGKLALPGERGELLATALADGFGEVGVGVRGEEQEWRRLAVLLAHEQQRDERRQDDRGRRDLERVERDELGQSLAEHPVAN